MIHTYMVEKCMLKIYFILTFFNNDISLDIPWKLLRFEMYVYTHGRLDGNEHITQSSDTGPGEECI